MRALRVAWLLALGALGIGGSGAAGAQKPRYSANIVRTAEGVAHVEARDMAGLGYGSGYAAAEDNGCVIADTLLTVRGERSRWFGAAGKAVVGFNEIPNLESDFYHRTVGDRAQIQAGFAATGADNRALLDGFAAGYNRYLRDHRPRFAARCRDAEWLRPMSHEDMLLLINGAMVQGSSAPFARAIAAAAPSGAAVASADGIALPDPGAVQGLGSNGWAFGRDAAKGRRGLLVGNPHFPWEGPNRFRRLHLTIPGRIDVMGAGLVYSPFVAIGFNRHVAWTHTVTTAQHQTLFALDLEPGDPTVYRVDGRREAMTRRQVTVEVKDGPPVTRMLHATRYGPMLVIPSAGLGWSATRGYAIRDADQANLRSGDAWLRIGRARNIGEVYRAIAETLGVPYVNTIAADRAGRVLYADVTAMPNVSYGKLAACASAQAQRAASQAAPIFILDGSRSACDWDVDRRTPVAGLMTPERLPALARLDWVQNSNDTYWLSNPKAPMRPFSPLLGQYGGMQNLRTRSGIREIAAALAEARIDMDTAKALALANKVFAAELILDELLALCPARPALARACAALAQWDRRAEAESRGALLFFYFWRRASGIKALWAVPFDARDPVGTPRGLNSAAAPAILDALQGAVEDVAKLDVAIDVPLGMVQVAPRGAERLAVHGGPSSAGVLNAMTSTPAAGALVPVHGTSYLQVVGFDRQGPVADTLLAYSQSSNPESRWYADATRAYSEKRWLRLPFTRAAIAAAQVGVAVTISE